MGAADSTAVRKVIIPAAGLGTRFFPITKTVAKELLPLGPLPALQYVVSEAQASGIDTVVLVTSGKKQNLTSYFNLDDYFHGGAFKTGHGAESLRDLEKLSKKLTFTTAEQTKPAGLGDAVRVGATKLSKGEWFAVMLPDDILVNHQPNLKLMIDLQQRTGKSVIGLQRVPRERLSAYGVVAGRPAIDGTYFEISDLVEKPAIEKAPSDLAVVGRYLLSPAAVAILQDLPAGKNGEIQLTDALRILAKQEGLVGFEIQGKRLDVGHPAGLLEANLFMSFFHGQIELPMVKAIADEAERLKRGSKT